MKCFLLLIGILLSFAVLGQSNSNIHSNTSLVQNYTSKTYKANPQIFSISQDKRGVMYFANQLGVIEFDGTTWSLIKTDNKHVLNLAQDDKGLIYVLCDGGYGVLVPDSSGKLIFESRLDLFKDEITANSFIVFRDAIFSDGFTYMKTKTELFKVDKDKVYKVQSSNAIGFVKKIGEIIYAKVTGIGLHQVKDKTLHLVKNGSDFAEMEIVDMIEFNKETLIVTKENGIFKLSSDQQEIELLDSLSGSVVSSVENNRDIFLILGTSNGLLLLDKKLDIYKRIGVQEGISDATIKTLFIDNENNLWIGSQNGISKIEIDTPIEIFNKKNALNGSIEAIEKFNNTIFCATLNGVYYIDSQGYAKKIKNLETDCYGLSAMKFGNDSLLLIAEVNGVYQIDQLFNLKHISKGGPYMFKQSPVNHNEVFAIHFNGISNFLYENGMLVEKNYIKEFSKGEPYNFLIQDNGTIWIGTLDDGVYQTTVNTFTDSTGYVHYDTTAGLPDGPSYLLEHENNIYAGTDLGLHVLKENKFVPTQQFSLGSSGTTRVLHRVSKDKKGNIWAVLIDKDNNYEIGYSSIREGKYQWRNDDFIKHSEEIVHGFYHDSNGSSWIGGPKGLIKYDDQYVKKEKQPFNCLIRKISMNDSLLFGGNNKLNTELEVQPIQINFSKNIPLTFEYSAPTFVDETKTVYSFFMEGHDQSWSEWSLRTLKEYNLREGSYTFFVKAKNIVRTESTVASYSIIVLPPWYRTVWAYISYIIVFILLIYFSIKLSVNRIKQQNIRLEETVQVRTKEVVKQKAEAEKQRDLVNEKNREITDSIQYAKRIQSAILPPDKVVKEYLKESFILYKPKDIVAGDFYWMENIEQKILFAAADCTGHGVPGAMVSVVCNNALNRSVREYGLTDPGEILDKTREIVIQEFEKSDEEVKDGMDIALCSIEGNQLKYAGANNPLWLIRKGEIIETKANKQPIGKFDTPLPYTTHTFELQKEDSVYIFSDGYVDQFGGVKGKKFKAKAFRTLLLSVQDQSMEKQKIIIDEAFENWRGNVEQVDDVCLIGVRV
jgi:serine phosphatase RsbU (regulator of sigma subunit)/ligand-binding sensor domain-containing protein